jgi:hypothetical protein
MPGGPISPNQKAFLLELFKEPNLAPSTKKSDHCSVNMHGQCYLKRKEWGDGLEPPVEDLLGIAIGETAGGEPLAHFHVTWQGLRWARIDAQSNPRIQTSWRVRLCRLRDTSSEELYFYSPDGDAIAALQRGWLADGQGWIDLQAAR